MQSEEFPLTQEFIAQMLGVRCSPLSRAGMYQPGEINILNREDLEATSCECYRVIQNEFARLLGNQPKRDR